MSTFAFALALVLLLVWWWRRDRHCARGRCYAASSAEAAALLAALEARLEAVAAAAGLAPLQRRLRENHREFGETSYYEGGRISVCARDRAAAGAPLHDLDVLTFVGLHELAHAHVAAAPGEHSDHGDFFWREFARLLATARRLGVYAAPDFAAAPVRYCGIVINYNPEYDPSYRQK